MIYRKLLAALSAIATASLAVPAAAQIVLEANGARAEGTWGGEVGAGYSLVNIGGFRLTPGAGAFFYKGDNDRYFMDDNGGNPRCRDRTSGAYAKDEKCDDGEAKLYARAEATYTLAGTVTAGLGARFMSGDLRPYGTIAIPLVPRVQIKGNVGEKYYAAGLQARF